MTGHAVARHRAGRAGGGRRTPVAVAAVLLVGGAVALAVPLWPSIHGTAATATVTTVTPVVVTADPSPSPAPPTLAAVLGTGLARSEPVRVQVEAIGVDSDLVDLGLAADGAVAVPEEGFPAGWYTGAPTPGETGPAVLIGHVDWDGEPGVFHRVRDLRPGDEVSVTRADGSVVVFAVDRVDQFAKDAFPTEEVYGDIDHAGLRLITCGGSFDDATGHYVDNLVAYAELVRVVGA